ncbi:transglycosylase domain-containing protein [Streptomyces griseoaurantiacus]
MSDESQRQQSAQGGPPGKPEPPAPGPASQRPDRGAAPSADRPKAAGKPAGAGTGSGEAAPGAGEAPASGSAGGADRTKTPGARPATGTPKPTGRGRTSGEGSGPGAKGGRGSGAPGGTGAPAAGPREQASREAISSRKTGPTGPTASTAPTGGKKPGPAGIGPTGGSPAAPTAGEGTGGKAPEAKGAEPESSAAKAAPSASAPGAGARPGRGASAAPRSGAAPTGTAGPGKPTSPGKPTGTGKPAGTTGQAGAPGAPGETMQLRAVDAAREADDTSPSRPPRGTGGKPPRPAAPGVGTAAAAAGTPVAADGPTPDDRPAPPGAPGTPDASGGPGAPAPGRTPRRRRPGAPTLKASAAAMGATAAAGAPGTPAPAGETMQLRTVAGTGPRPGRGTGTQSDGELTTAFPEGTAGSAEDAAPPANRKERRAAKKAARKAKRTGWRRLLPTWRMVLGGFLFVCAAVIGAFFYGYHVVQIPAANTAAVKQSNVYLYADGSRLARDGKVNRENVKLSQISEEAQHAALAAEDRDFYTEAAIDPKATVRAAWNTATGKGKQSGSTITQQYVKNYYLAQEQTVTRKAKEFFISIKLDREKSKQEILEGYLNTSFFGRNSYGIQAAAQAYYGVDAKDLTAEQGAYLAALLNAPSEYDVVAHPENKAAAKARWNYVLDGMVDKGWLSKSERAGAKFPQPKQTVIAAGMSGQRGYLVKAVNDYLVGHHILDEDDLAAGGYRITTTLQKPKQDAFVKAVDDQVTDKLDKKNRKVDRYVRAGGVSIDPATGKVLAMYGGIDYTKQYYNNATRRDYQVGSTFKPFVFTSAVENGARTQGGATITPNTVYDGTDKRSVQGWSGGAYAPENEDNVSYGKISVRQATDKSVNSVYAQMAVDVGPSAVKKTAVSLGLPANTPDLQPYPSIALGTATASVLDMAEAYATLANHGKHGTYTLVEKITREGSEEVKLPDTAPKQAVGRTSADTTTQVLRSVVQSGTATAAQQAGRPAAGKTGTAEEDQAAWFAGYTPDLATVVAVMGQDPDTGAHKSLYGAMGMPRINGGGPPAQIWAQFTKAALKGKPVKDFDLKLQRGAERTVDPDEETSGDPSSSSSPETTGGTGGDGGTGGNESPGGDAGGTPADGGAGNGGADAGGGDAANGGNGAQTAGAGNGGVGGGDAGNGGGDAGGTGANAGAGGAGGAGGDGGAGGGDAGQGGGGLIPQLGSGRRE